ncbi:MAG: RES family NAD+ phosphorylase [Clostridiales bacterium]|nr:RES family NAD+ phosphorylase [Clostridiales bacterium]
MNTWLTEEFIDQEFYAPFVISKDADYYSDLSNRLSLLARKAQALNADKDSLKTIKQYTEKILEAIRNYYRGNVISFHQIIKNLVKGCLDEALAVNTIASSSAFPGIRGAELQLFRGRISHTSIPFKAKDMLYLPKDSRGKADSYRFSIPGVPCLYLGNSSYACWLELNRPLYHDFVVSPVILDNTLKILNLAVMIRGFYVIKSTEQVKCWLKLLILMIATSYRIDEDNRKFKSEYIVSQSIMLACNDLGLDGVAYFSKRVEDEIFSQAAINLALFVKYKNIYSKCSLIDNHIKLGNSFNYEMFRQIEWSEDYKYDLRCLNTGLKNKVGDYERQYAYCDTAFCKFDQFLFSGWKNKDKIDFGTGF